QHDSTLASKHFYESFGIVECRQPAACAHVHRAELFVRPVIHAHLDCTYDVADVECFSDHSALRKQLEIFVAQRHFGETIDKTVDLPEAIEAWQAKNRNLRAREMLEELFCPTFSRCIERAGTGWMILLVREAARLRINAQRRSVNDLLRRR